MKKKLKLTPRTTAACLAVLAVLLAAIGWFALISPKRSQASALGQELATTQSSIDQARLALARSRGQHRHQGSQPQLHTTDLFRLVRAMPDAANMADILLELNQVAKASGVSLDTVSPAGAIPVSGNYQSIPLTVAISGNYYSLADFLYRTRDLVLVRDQTLTSTGRLFTVDSVTVAEGANKFPNVSVTLNMSAYAYGGGITAPGSAPAGTTSSTTTPPAATPTAPATPPTAITPTTPPNSGGTAAGATP